MLFTKEQTGALHYQQTMTLNDSDLLLLVLSQDGVEYEKP